QTRRAYRRILSVEAIVSNVPITQRTIEASPARQCQAAVRDGVRCAVYIDSGRSASIKGVRDLRKSAVEREGSGQADRHLSFVAVGTARSLQFERAIIGNVNLLIGAVDQEQVSRHRNAPHLIRSADLIEVCRCDTRRIGTLHDSARILRVNAASIIKADG